MTIRRRTMLAAGGAAAFANFRSVHAAEVVNPLASAIAADGRSIKLVHVAAMNGIAAIADIERPPDPSPYPLFQQFLTHKASATAIYSAPPHHKMMTPISTANTLVLIVAGETMLEAGSTRRLCTAGTVILLEGGSGTFRDTAGPDGYTALKVVLAD